MFMDGKTLANDQMVIVVGVTMEGDKVFLGFAQTDTENEAIITSFLRSLKDRGLDLSAGPLWWWTERSGPESDPGYSATATSRFCAPPSRRNSGSPFPRVSHS